MEYLFEVWPVLSAGIRASSHLLLLSDYDGTLTPIVSRPDEAVLSPEVREKLRALAQRPACSVGIISGRPLKELETMVSLKGVYYAGNHGLEIEGPGLSFVSQPAETARSTMAGLARELAIALGSIEGIYIEDKGLSLSVHYRQVSEGDLEAAEKAFQGVTAPLFDRGKVRLTHGKKVWEIRPPIDWHKGKAVEAITREIKTVLRLESVLTLYLGDDTTDEDAFRVVQPPEGWSIFIGGENPFSSAAYFLHSTAEVEDLLSRLIDSK